MLHFLLKHDSKREACVSGWAARQGASESAGAADDERRARGHATAGEQPLAELQL